MAPTEGEYTPFTIRPTNKRDAAHSTIGTEVASVEAAGIAVLNVHMSKPYTASFGESSTEWRQTQSSSLSLIVYRTADMSFPKR